MEVIKALLFSFSILLPFLVFMGLILQTHAEQAKRELRLRESKHAYRGAALSAGLFVTTCKLMRRNPAEAYRGSVYGGPR